MVILRDVKPASYNAELNHIVEELNRAAGTPRQGSAQPGTSSLGELLGLAARQHATDVLLVAGSPVTLRIYGALTAAAGPPLTDDDGRALILPLLDNRSYTELQKVKSIDFGFEREGAG